jgi:membrane associated rhomboid family serine protease
VASRHSVYGLDGLDFLTASMRAGFGSFVVIQLVENHWPAEAIGFALTLSTVSSLVSQVPAGVFIDSIDDKRRAVRLGVIGISGAVFGVMMALVAADLTRGTGRFNLTLGALGVAIAIGASPSTLFAGVTVAAFGGKVAYFGLALAGLCGLLLLWVAMPETHPSTAAAPGAHVDGKDRHDPG